MKVVDLSVPLNEKTPVYPGDPVTKIGTGGVLENDGYEDHYVSVGTHVGTHIDAPAHMIVGGSTLNKIDVDHFIGRGRLIVVKDRKFDLEAIKQAGIQAGEIVLFHTGMSSVYHESAYYDEYPAITEEIANYLVEQKIKMVGVDMCSVDHEPFDVHKIFLNNNILIIENLTNLEALVGKEFEVTGLPINLEIDGAPARVIARVQ